MNKKYYIIGAIIILLLIGAGLLFLTSNNKPKVKTGPVNLTWWKTFEDSENLSEIISEYQKQHRNVTINYIKKNIDDYEQELIDALASGKGPDIISIHNDWLPRHIDKLISMPESLLTVRSYKDTFVDVASSDFIKDNKIYALPLSMDVLALYYNKDLLGSNGISNPPKTWPELVSAVEKITKLGQAGSFNSQGIAMGTSNNVNRAVDILLLLMLQNGTKFYADDFSSAVFDQQQSNVSGESYNPAATALEFYTQFTTPSKKSYTWNSKSDFSVDSFTQNKVAMMLSFSYMMPVIKNKAPNLNWGVVAVPQISEAAIKVNFSNYWGEAVSKFSKNPEVAYDFLNFAASRDMLKKYYGKHKLPSSRKDILAEQIADPDIGVFAESALTAKSVYKKNPAVFESVFLKMIDDVILRNLTPEEAVRNAAQQINLSLQK